MRLTLESFVSDPRGIRVHGSDSERTPRITTMIVIFEVVLGVIRFQTIVHKKWSIGEGREPP